MTTSVKRTLAPLDRREIRPLQLSPLPVDQQAAGDARRPRGLPALADSQSLRLDDRFVLFLR